MNSIISSLKIFGKFIIGLLIPTISIAQNLDCKNIHEGIYKSHDLYGSLNTIVRTKNKQTVTWGRSVKEIEYDILWTSDCTYLLYNQKVLVGNDSMLFMNNSDMIYNEIIEVNKYWHKIIFSVNGDEPKSETSYFNIDTLIQYRDLSQVDKLKEFTGASYGATFVGYNYAITYKQNAIDRNNFVIAFLEALTVNKKSKFKMLDNICCTLDSNQKITVSNCRYNNKYDKEIIAIYNSSYSNDEAQIVRAWRFNKMKMKIEEVETDKVKYKEADKFLTIWDQD